MNDNKPQDAKILIVDDNPTNLEILSNYLIQSGYAVFVKKSGLKALESLEMHRPDIILLDVVMPEIDGFETCRRLKENDLTKDIPVIFMTALSDIDDKVRGLQLGAVDYITKPFHQEEVLERVNTHLTIKNLQQKLQKKNTELQSALDRERRIISDLRLSLSLALPHELRTPLTVILGFSSFLTTLEKLPTPEQIVQYGNNIYHNSLRLYRLIENALIYANLKLLKYTSGDKRPVLSDTTDNIARMVYSIAQPKASDAGREQDLMLNVENAAIQVNPTHFEKIFTELLDNAFKNSQPGTPVNLKAFVKDQSWVLHISDEGRGMSKEQIENIGAFIQFDRASHEQQGLGLGLTIAYLLTSLESGKLSIDSKPQHGTTVSLMFHCEGGAFSHPAEQKDCWLEMPLPERPMFRDPKGSIEREILGYITAHDAALSSVPEDEKNSYTLLSIDHTWINGDALRKLLEPLGFDLIEAFDEFDGIRKIIKNPPDIIFWDASNAEQQAFELVQQIRRSIMKGQAKIVVLTDNTHETELLHKLKGYCDDVWRKPVSAQTIFEKFPQLLRLQWVYK